MTIPDSIGDESIVLEVNDKKIDRWSRYSFNNHFLNPTDGFLFEVGGDAITNDLIGLLSPGGRVRLTVNGLVQATGYIDVYDPQTTRDGGTKLTIEGRDTFGPVVDSQVDSKKHYPETETLDKFLQATLGPYGFKEFLIDNGDNISVSAGRALQKKRLPGGHKKKRHGSSKKGALNEYRLKSSKPQHNECMFSFISRITQRFGLWIWPDVNGEKVIVSTPNYDQAASFQIVNRREYTLENNVLSGGIRRDYTGQPSFLVARGAVPGKTFQRTKISAVLHSALDVAVAANGTGRDQQAANVQPKLGLGEHPFFEVSDGYLVEKETVVLPPSDLECRVDFASLVARPLFLHDDHSRSPDELEAFIRREMSLRQRHAIVGRYVVPGHTQNGIPWQIDSVVDVVDEVSAWEGPMWILSRTFRKDKKNGTTTEIECLPLNMIAF